MSVMVAINGFGRIGRSFLRAVMNDAQAREQITIACINLGPRATTDHIATLFAHDSLMGTFPGEVRATADTLIIDDHSIDLLCVADPAQAGWGARRIDWVVEATGHFTKRVQATQHLQAGAKNVLITAPSDDADCSIIPGVNMSAYHPQEHHLISLGSCTTNCLAPLIDVIHRTWRIEWALMTTVHAYTNDQVLLDGEHSDPRRARAAALNIIPTKTGAAQSILHIFPDLKNKISAHALRVPVPKVSFLELTTLCTKQPTREDVNNTFKMASSTQLTGILAYTDLPLVSSDFAQTPYSAIFDSSLTRLSGPLLSVTAWYDNEYGYACRLKDFLLHN